MPRNYRMLVHLGPQQSCGSEVWRWVSHMRDFQGQDPGESVWVSNLLTGLFQDQAYLQYLHCPISEPPVAKGNYWAPAMCWVWIVICCKNEIHIRLQSWHIYKWIYWVRWPTYFDLPETFLVLALKQKACIPGNSLVLDKLGQLVSHFTIG